MFLFGYKRDVVRNVARFGWHCVQVRADDGGPDFAYTVGLWESLGVPELVTFGLPPEVMLNILGETIEQLRAGARLEDGARWSGLIDGFDCVSRAVHPDHLPSEHFNLALWYRERQLGTSDGLQAHQLVWPSKADGRFPWDDGVAQTVRDAQLALYLPLTAAAA